MIKNNKEKKFKTLRKNHKKQIVIGAIVVCVIGGALTFATSRAKYRVTEDIKLASGSVNYKPYDFKIMAMYKSDDGVNYSEITTMPGSDYTINTSKSYCTTDNINKVYNKLKTENAEHKFENMQKSDKCYIYFDKVKITNSTILIANSKINTSAVDYSKVATTDEGIHVTSDGMYGGTSYYWRGAATTNHLIFANMCWRIVRINGDKSIRLIYNGGVLSGNTCAGNGDNIASIAFNNTAYNVDMNNSSYVGWTYNLGSQRPENNASATASIAKVQVDSWYNNNIGNNATFAAKVADGKFCNDRNTGNVPTNWLWNSNTKIWSENGERFTYASVERIGITQAPTLSCSIDDIYTLKAGAITADEVLLAGGNAYYGNEKYYLYNGQLYWTMSPNSWSGMSSAIYVISKGGSLIGRNLNGLDIDKGEYGHRPVINLRAETTFSSGNGIASSPYIVS